MIHERRSSATAYEKKNTPGETITSLTYRSQNWLILELGSAILVAANCPTGLYNHCVKSIPPMKRLLFLILPFFLVTACEDINLLLLTDAASDAVTAVTLSDEDVSRLAARAAQTFDDRSVLAGADNPHHKRLQRLTADYTRRDGKTFTFRAYLTEEVNAFALADGSVRVYSGLMDLMTDEELLFVIGHEMGHVILEHSRRKVALAYASSAARKGLAAQNSEIGQIAGSVLGAFTEQLVHAQFSQHEERRADDYGNAFLQAEGYDRSAAVSALYKLAEMTRGHSFLSSHPDPKKRAERLLQGDVVEEEHRSLLETIYGYAKTVFLWSVELITSLLHQFWNSCPRPTMVL
jgi:putative metalloprotease